MCNVYPKIGSRLDSLRLDRSSVTEWINKLYCSVVVVVVVVCEFWLLSETIFRFSIFASRTKAFNECGQTTRMDGNGVVITCVSRSIWYGESKSLLEFRFNDWCLTLYEVCAHALANPIVLASMCLVIIFFYTKLGYVLITIDLNDCEQYLLCECWLLSATTSSETQDRNQQKFILKTLRCCAFASLPYGARVCAPMTTKQVLSHSTSG